MGVGMLIVGVIEFFPLEQYSLRCFIKGSGDTFSVFVMVDMQRIGSFLRPVYRRGFGALSGYIQPVYKYPAFDGRIKEGLRSVNKPGVKAPNHLHFDYSKYTDQA